MVKYLDGFKIAEIDLKLRGPGDIFGIKQSGFPDLKFTNIAEDQELILEAKQSAFKLIEIDPKLEKKISAIIRRNLIKHYSENLSYAKIA